jgi:membrane protease YdiL (CAAX protease family)
MVAADGRSYSEALGRGAIAGITWRPTRDTAVAIASYGLVVAILYLAFQVFTTDRVAANFIAFGIVGLALVGIGIPISYTVFVRRKPIADLGLTTHLLVPSVALGLVLGWDTYRNTIGAMDVVWSSSLVPVATMSLAVGLFEAVFFRGWLQLRFEEAFGLVPGLLLGALCYSLYHVGYGMEGSEMLYLFGLGLVFGAMFRLTQNVFVLWPFYTPVGGLYANLSDGLEMPFEATYGFVIVLVLMAVMIVGARFIRRPRAFEALPVAAVGADSVPGR